MELKIKDRMLILAVLPKEGDIASLRILRDLKKDLSFSEEEYKEFQFKINSQGSYTWIEPNDQPFVKEISIGDKAKDLISESLKELNSRKKLGFDYIDLYESFIGVE